MVAYDRSLAKQDEWWDETRDADIVYLKKISNVFRMIVRREGKAFNLENFVQPAYSSVQLDINTETYDHFVIDKEEENLERFREFQDAIMKEQIPILTKLLDETMFDDGYKSQAEKYFDDLSAKYGTIADTILMNIYLRNMYSGSQVLKHILFIIANLSEEKRANLQIIPLAGLSNPDIEIQDLSVRCIETWEDKRHIATLREVRDKANVVWFRDYVDEVIKELEEV